jgi:ferredoxin-NADP reductase
MNRIKKSVVVLRDMVVPEPVHDFWCEEFGLISRRNQPVAKAIKVVSETSETVSIWLKPNKNFKGVLPGQHINIGVRINGHMVQRSYSVSHVKGRLFRITARKVENGLASSYLNLHARKGLIVQLGEVYGSVTVSQFNDKPALFLAGGIGITPIISMVENWAGSFRTQPVQLLYWGKRAQDLAFVERLKKLAAEHSWFEFKLLETEFVERLEDGAPKLIAETSAWFQEMKRKLPTFNAFACGNDGFVEQIQEKIAPWVNQFHFESFSPLAIANQPGAPVQIRLSKLQKTVSVPSGVNLLMALERAGVPVSSGCRRGTCNTCSCKKVSGIAQHQVDQTLNEHSDTGFKPCAHTALSDITLEL